MVELVSINFAISIIVLKDIKLILILKSTSENKDNLCNKINFDF